MRVFPTVMKKGGVQALAALALLYASPLYAQDAANFPSRNITLVVPYAAGGPPDVASRILSPYLSQALGRQVVVENRAGGTTTLGARSVARSTPDGHTLLLADVSLPVAVNLVSNAGYDPQKDFAPIAPILRTFMGLVVHPDVPAKSVKELVAYAKANPGKLKYGTSGVGSPPYLGALVFINATEIEMLHVPYRGVALALNDVVAGHLSLAFMSQSTAGSQLAAGKVRVLGVYGEKRVSSIPDIPTFREQGLDTRIADQGVWFGIATTAGTPKDIVAKLNKVVNDALKDPTTKAALEKADYNLTGGTPEDLKALIDEHTVYWKGALAKAGIKPEEAK
jgi:tripartite-type tricarboxylate transporter receptor subunit TctC